MPPPIYVFLPAKCTVSQRALHKESRSKLANPLLEAVLDLEVTIVSELFYETNPMAIYNCSYRMPLVLHRTP